MHPLYSAKHAQHSEWVEMANGYCALPANQKKLLLCKGLLARMRAQLRQFANTEDAVFSIGPYSFQPANKIMLHGENDQKIRLTEKETAILKYLLRAQDKVVGRDTLLGEVWGYNANVTTHTLETHVYRLRQKIEEDPSNARILVTENGGYKLVP